MLPSPFSLRGNNALDCSPTFLRTSCCGFRRRCTWLCKDQHTSVPHCSEAHSRKYATSPYLILDSLGLVKNSRRSLCELGPNRFPVTLLDWTIISVLVFQVHASLW